MIMIFDNYDDDDGYDVDHDDNYGDNNDYDYYGTY